jgi:hypothetical protein
MPQEPGLKKDYFSADPDRNVRTGLAMMSFAPLLRIVGGPRRARRSAAVAAKAPAGTQHRHPAMSGIDVSPVHGWHCICDRCLAHAQKQP